MGRPLPFGLLAGLGARVLSRHFSDSGSAKCFGPEPVD